MGRAYERTSSMTASMTMSQSASACAPRPGVMRPSVAETEAVASASDIFPFFTALLASFSTEPVIRFMPPSRKRCSCSTAMTLKPFSAAVCAIPWPIRPRPTTPTVVMPCDASAEKRRTCDERSAGERRRPRDSMMTTGAWRLMTRRRRGRTRSHSTTTLLDYAVTVVTCPSSVA